MDKKGGTISGAGAELLHIARSDGNPYISFYTNSNFLGRLGFSTNGEPIAIVNTQLATLIHSGNIGDYALKYTKVGTTTATQMPALNTFGLWNEIGPYIRLGYSDSYNIAFRVYLGDLQAQLNANSPSHSDWKTIAFTDSNVASATKLQTKRKLWGNDFDGTADISGHIILPNSRAIYGVSADGTTNLQLVLLDSSNNLTIGNGIAKDVEKDTSILGNNVYLKYGKSAATGLILNSSGNVGIGTISPAYKLDVNGTARITDNVIIGVSSLENGRLKIVGENTSASTPALYISNSGGNPLLDVRNNGNVGIGTTDPAYKLDVNGSFNATSGYINGNAIIHSGNIGSQSVNYANSAGSANSVAWGNVTGKPGSFTPSAHTHTRSQITDFPSSLPASDVYAWAKASSKPTYTAAEVGALPTSGGIITGGTITIGSAGLPLLGGAQIPTNQMAIGRNGIAISCTDTRNDAAAIFVENISSESNRLVIAMGDDATSAQDYIVFRQYTTSGIVGHEVTVPRTSGTLALTSQIPTNTNQLTNGAGFITGITKAMVINALGYTPPSSDTNTWRPIYNGVDSTATDTSASANAVKTAYDKAVSAYNLANGKTSNTGTVTSVATGTGLTGGTITSTGTISINTTYQGYITNGNNAWASHTKLAANKINAIPVTHKVVTCPISAAGTFGIIGTMTAGQVIHVIVQNTTTSAITVTIPNSGSYHSFSGTSLSVPASKYAEINVVYNGEKMFIRTAY